MTGARAAVLRVRTEEAMAKQRDWNRDFPDGPAVRGTLDEVPGARDAVVLAHGAGGNRDGKLLVALADALAARGFAVLRIDLPFRQKRAAGPPHPSGAAADREGIRRAAESLRDAYPGRVFLAGSSYGGRQASMLAAEDPRAAAGLPAALLSPTSAGQAGEAAHRALAADLGPGAVRTRHARRFWDSRGARSGSPVVAREVRNPLDRRCRARTRHGSDPARDGPRDGRRDRRRVLSPRRNDLRPIPAGVTANLAMISSTHGGIRSW